MGSFFGDLAQGLGDYAKYRIGDSPIGRAILGGMQQRQQQKKFDQQMEGGMERDVQGQDALTPSPDIPANDQTPNPIAAQSAVPSAASPPQSMFTPEPMAAGKVVTSPTVALLGDKGPEAVVPLTDQPGNRVSTKMFGTGGIRTRYRHPQGPVASGRTRPITGDLPIRPNPVLR